MGASRPRYVQAWTDYRGVFDGVVGNPDMNTEPEPAGYNPDMKRATCSECGDLSWHRYGLFSKNWKCVSCGHTEIDL